MAIPNAASKTNQLPQLSIEELGTALSEVTFVAVDLETTGASVRSGSAITEIGAVKYRGGIEVGSFQTFVNPETPIPAYITVLTGITDAMVVAAPKIGEAFASLLEFFGSPNETVLIAHNAPFDISFLKAAASELSYRWPNYRVFDSAKMARRTLTREEVRDCKLATLASYFGTQIQPNHRALSDAQATIEVWHGILERLGSMNIKTLEDLADFSSQVTVEQRNKRHLMADLPSSPGVYIFRDRLNNPLYIGTSKNLKARVRSYFSAAESRSRIREMIAIAERIDYIKCATVIEAQVRELRLISEKQPRYNRRSRFQEQAVWVKLTNENFPRLISTRGIPEVSNQKLTFGPFNSKEGAQNAIDALHEVVNLRQCNNRNFDLSKKSKSACVLYEMKRCAGACIGLESQSQYEKHVNQTIRYVLIDAKPVHKSLTERMTDLAQAERFEDAEAIKSRLFAFLIGSDRSQNLLNFVSIKNMIVMKAIGSDFEIIHIRHGRLVGSAVANQMTISDVVTSLNQSSEVISLDKKLLPAATYEESEKLLSYLFNDNFEILEIDGAWTLPVNGSGAIRHRAPAFN
jgi:DNA polymerase-3 subunit epsilon